jgi:hypothetical protein
MWANHNGRAHPGTLAVFSFLCLAVFVGCGGGNSSTPAPAPSPDFTILIQPATLSVVVGTSTQFQIKLLPQNGFNGTASISANSLPSGISTSPALPQNLGPSGLNLTLLAANNASDGAYSLQLMAASGSLQHSATLPFTIGNRANLSIQVPPQVLNVAKGGSAASSGIDVTIDSGIVDYSVQLHASAPSGVTASFSNTTIVPPVHVTLTLTASATATPGPGSVNVRATRSVDGLSVSSNLPIYIDPQPGAIPGNRTSWVRTGSNPITTYYDAPRNRVLASVPALNLLDVIDPSAGAIVSSIPVSLAGNEPNGVWLASSSNISGTVDGKSLLALGVGHVTTIDLTSSQIVARRPLPMAVSIGRTAPDFIHPGFLVAATGGRIVLGTWGDSSFYNWDGVSALASQHLLSDLYSFDRNFNGTMVLIAAGDSSGAYQLLDVASDAITKRGAYSNATVMTVRGNPVRDEWAIANSNGVDFLDANLTLVANIPAVFVGSATYWGMTYSPDGKYLYFVYSPAGLPLLITVDAVAHSVVRIAPATGTDLPFNGRDPPEFIEQPISSDKSGLVFGLGEKGMVIDDSTYGIDPTQATAAYHAIIATPDSGPVIAATPVQITTQSYNAQPDVWFGFQRAQTESLSSAGQVAATAPPAQIAGPVNIRLFPPDGYAHVMPQAFTYGTVITSIRNSVCGAGGGCSADIFGFGLFGSNPSQSTVTIGGNAVPVQSAHYFNADRPYPYPVQYLTVTAPVGMAGRADVIVNTANGSATLPGGFLYANSVRSYPSPQPYNALLYDKKRSLLYASTNTGISRYSVSSGTFLAAIVPPTLTGQSEFQGMSLTPDGSRLLVANRRDVSVAVIDPDHPSTATAVAVPVLANSSGPQFVAATSAEEVFVTMSGFSFPTSGLLFELDLSTMRMRQRTDPNVFWLRDPTMLSPTGDGTRVIVHSYNDPVLMWDAATDQFNIHWGAGGPGAAVCAAAADGNLFAVSQGIVDENLNSMITMAIPDEIAPAFLMSPLTDAALNDSGSLWFVPFGKTLTIFDTQHGGALRTVALQNQVNIWTKVIAVDDTAQHVFLSDAQGLTVYEFAAAPLAIGSVTPSIVPSVGSVVVKIRGSGFQSGTVVTIGGKVAPTTFIDVNTIEVTVPANPVGAAQMKVQNPDGEGYKLDAALVYQ